MVRGLLLSLILIGVLPLWPDSAPAEYVLSPWKFTVGDDPAYRQAELDDSGWKKVSIRAIPFRPRGVKWLRCRIELPDGCGPILFSVRDLMMAYEVYWDGKPVGGNGRVGVSAETEVEGKLYFSTFIDSSLTRRGSHLLAIRYSNFQALPLAEAAILPLLSDGRKTIPYLNRYTHRMLLNFGISFTIFLLGLVLYLGGGLYKSYIHFSLITTPAWIIYGFTFIQYALNFSARYTCFQKVTGLILLLGTEFFIGLFFLAYFRLPGRWLWLGLLFTLLASEFVLELIGIIRINSLAYRIAIGCKSLLTISFIVYGIVRKKPGALIFLSAYLVFLSTDFLEMAGTRPGYLWYDLSFQLFIFILIFTITIQIRAQNRLQQTLQARTGRLEMEILKKAIQPHFIMNTLASLHSWSKRDPAKAARMIQAIAKEYRSLNEMASQVRIPLETELELCRSHLELMGFRRDANYQLLVDSDCRDLQVPPLIFHTLIENGLTHAIKPQEDGLFTFSCRQEPGRVRYLLKNNGSLLSGEPDTASRKIQEGTGLRYVRARLEEAFPGKWQLDYGLKDGLWTVEIVIDGRVG